MAEDIIPYDSRHMHYAFVAYYDAITMNLNNNENHHHFYNQRLHVHMNTLSEIATVFPILKSQDKTKYNNNFVCHFNAK